MPGQIRCRIITVLVASVLLASFSSVASAQIRFDLPAQPLAQALTAVGSLANLNIYFDAPTVDGIQAPALKAQLSADEALARLLAGTKLHAVHVDANTVRVVAETESKHAQAGQPPLTDTNTRSSGVHLASADGATPASSATGPDDTGSPSASYFQQPKEMQEVVVSGHYEFLSADTSGTTNLPLPIEKVPQSISLVSNDFIEAANLKTLGEIAEYTPGAINVGSSENYQTSIYLRGFSPGKAVDGLPSGYSLYEPDYAIIDRLEVVKGPSSVVYGISSPGGLVNFVTKSATPETKDYLYVQGGSWHSFRAEGQVAGALDTDGHVRGIAVAVQDQGDSFFNDLYHKKTTAYAGINVNITDSISGYLHGGYERFERPSFDGNPVLPDGSSPPVLRSFCLCSESVVMVSSVYHAEGDLSWHVNDMLDLSLKGEYERAKTTGETIYGYSLDDTGSVNLIGGTLSALYDNYAVGLSGIYHFDNLGLKNSFVSVAALYQDNRSDSSGLTAASATNILQGQSGVTSDINSVVATARTSYDSFVDALQKTTNTTVSAQGVFQVLSPLSVLLGVSYSKPEIKENIYGTVGDFKPAGQASYRAGLTYEFLPGANAYFSYSQSFSPQGGFQINGTNLPNLTGDQYEAGVKYRTSSGRLILSGAVYQITEKNVAQFAEQLGAISYYEPIGEVRHRGFELQALGQLTPQWQINAGYSYLDPIITNAPASAAATIGQTQLFLPKQTLSLYTTYTLDQGVLHGLSFGGGARYISSERTSYESDLANSQAFLTPSNDLPGYTLVDLTASYSLDKWLLQLNARNVLNHRYFINNYQTLAFGNLPGDPTNFSISLRRTF
jgi:iron complex outermembrane receptor protein